MTDTINKYTLCGFCDEVGADLSVQIAAMKENGLKYLEMRNVNGTNVSDLTPEQAKNAADMLAAEGLGVWSLGSPIGKINITDDFGAHMDKFKRTLDVAHTVGAKCVRIFSFYGTDGKPEYRDDVCEKLDRLVDASKGSGVVLCHENEKGIYGDTKERCVDILSSVNGLKAVFDPANFVQSGENTLEAWDALAPFVKYFHIKDVNKDDVIVPAGLGRGNIPVILKKYLAQGGEVITMEPHLTVFDGLAALENGEKTKIDDGAWGSPAEAFKTATDALKKILKSYEEI